MADHIVYKCVSLQSTDGYSDANSGNLITSATTSISVTGCTTTVNGRLPLAFSSGAIDSENFEGSTTWTSDDPDVTSEAFLWWCNTSTGVGGGISSGGGQLVTAGSSGTFSSTWSAATKQANISFAIYGAGPSTYDQTTGAGTNNVTVTEPIYGGGFKLVLLVQTANELIDTNLPAGWSLVGTTGTGTAGASGSTRIYIFWADAGVSMPTLTILADTPDLRFPVCPTPTRRKPNIALTVAAAVVPFVATIADLETETSWQPKYADRVPAKPRAVNTGGSFAPAPDPIPNPEIPDLTWQPGYADRVDRKPRQPHLVGGVTEPTVPITAYYSNSAAGGATLGTSDRTIAITPDIGDLICVFASFSANTNTGMTATDDLGGKYYLAGTALWGSSLNIGAVFVRTSLCTSGSAHTITIASGSNTAGALVAVTAKGMTRAGKNAVRSFGSQADQASTTTPAPALNQAAEFDNMTLVAVASGDTTTGPPTLWTERQDTNQGSPTTALEVATRDFGFEGTTITFSATQSATYASFALELDGSPLTTGDWWPVYPDFARRAPPRPHGGMVQPPYDTSSPVSTDIGWLPSFPDFAYRPRRNPEGCEPFVFCTGGEAFSIGVASCEQKENAVSPETGTWSTYATNIAITAVTNATDLFTSASHGMKTGDGPYRFSTTGTLPAGLSSTTDYYVDVESANTFKVSTTAANALANSNVAISDDGTGTLTLVRAINTQPLGSALVVFGARGQWNLDSSAPTDNKGNTFTAAAGSPRAYAGFPNSDAWVGYKLGAAGGSAHTFSLTYQGFDEPTVGAIEIFGVNRLQDSSWVERAIGSTTITSNSVTTTAKAILIAIVGGNGPTGQDHTFAFGDGFTKIPAASDEGDISSNGYIQFSAAYKVVNGPGTYTFSAQGVALEGAQMFLLAFQAAASQDTNLDWYRQPSEPVRRLRTTREGDLTEPIQSTPEVFANWQPEYPDRVPGPRRNPEGGTFAPPSDTSNVPYASWLPTFADFARRFPPRQTAGMAAPPWDRSDVPYLSWSPDYPDRCPPARRNPFGGLAEPPSAEGSTSLLLYWAPTYPDFARKAPPRITAGMFAPGRDDLDVPFLSWQPDYPDFARAPKPRLPGIIAAPPLDTSHVPYLAWQPDYPDRCPPARRNPFGGTSEPPQDRSDVPLLAWSPTFADFAPGPLPRPHGGTYDPPSDTNAGPLCWEPEFPDFARRHPPRPHGGLTAPPYDTSDVPYRSWAPTHPDWIARRHQAERLEAFQCAVDFQAPALSWGPSYPDSAPGPLPRLEGGLFQPPSDTSNTPYRSWAPVFPDQIARRHLADRLEFYAVLLDFGTPDRSWSPTYPDAAPGAPPRIEGGRFAPPYETSSVPLRAWDPVYPSRTVLGPAPRPHGGMVAPPSDTGNVPYRAWAPVYPDLARGHRPRLTGGTFQPPADVSNVPYLAWSPIYPSFAHAHRPRLPGWFAAPSSDTSTPETLTFWSPLYPDFARGMRRNPVGGTAQPPLDTSNVTALSWSSRYPDILRPAKRIILSALTEAPFQPPPVIFATAFWPDFARAPRQPVYVTAQGMFTPVLTVTLPDWFYDLEASVESTEVWSATVMQFGEWAADFRAPETWSATLTRIDEDDV